MKGKAILGWALVLLVAPSAVWAAEVKTKAPSKEAVAWSADEMKWDAMPGVDGVQVAMLWGDMKKGPYGALVKLPANQDHPLHTYSSTCKLVVLSGEFRYTPEGGTEKVLGPGSYLMVPGKLRHSSASGPEGVTMFQESQGGWDLLPVAGPAAAATK